MDTYSNTDAPEKHTKSKKPDTKSLCVYVMSRTGKLIDIENTSVVARGWGLRNEKSKGPLMDMGFLLGVMRMFYNQIVLPVAQVREFTQYH